MYQTAILNVEGKMPIAGQDRLYEESGVEDNPVINRWLDEDGVPYAENPLMDTTAEHFCLKEMDDILDKVIMLMVLALKCEGEEQSKLDFYIREYELSGKFTPDEEEYLQLDEPDKEESQDYQLCTESMWVLLWVLGLIEEIGKIDGVVSETIAIGRVITRTPDLLRSEINLRTLEEVLVELEVYGRKVWDIEVAGDMYPDDVAIQDILIERYSALRWAIKPV